MPRASSVPLGALLEIALLATFIVKEGLWFVQICRRTSPLIIHVFRNSQSIFLFPKMAFVLSNPVFDKLHPFVFLNYPDRMATQSRCFVRFLGGQVVRSASMLASPPDSILASAIAARTS